MLSDIFEDRIGRVRELDQLTISRAEQSKTLEQRVLLFIEQIGLRLRDFGESLQNIIIEHDFTAPVCAAVLKHLEMCHTIGPGQEIGPRLKLVKFGPQHLRRRLQYILRVGHVGTKRQNVAIDATLIGQKHRHKLVIRLGFAGWGLLIFGHEALHLRLMATRAEGPPVIMQCRFGPQCVSENNSLLAFPAATLMLAVICVSPTS